MGAVGATFCEVSHREVLNNHFSKVVIIIFKYSALKDNQHDYFTLSFNIGESGGNIESSFLEIV